MNYKLESELSTILYHIELYNAKLDLFIANNKSELTDFEIYDKINAGFQTINNGISIVTELF